MNIERLLTNVCSKDLESSKKFYVSLFDFNIDYDSDWFVHLISTGKELELGIISEASEIVPEQVKGQSSGVYLTFVVENVDELFLKAKSLKLNILQAPQNTSYGQKRMIIMAPEGTVCDVSSPKSA